MSCARVSTRFFFYIFSIFLILPLSLYFCILISGPTLCFAKWTHTKKKMGGRHLQSRPHHIHLPIVYNGQWEREG